MSMRVATIGTCVGADIIRKSNQRKSSRTLVSYALFAFLESSICMDLSSYFDVFDDENEAKKIEMITYLKGLKCLANELNHEADIILCDLADFRIDTTVYEFENGEKVAFKSYLFSKQNENKLIDILQKKMGSVVKEERKLSMDNLSDEELSKYLIRYCAAIQSLFSGRVIFFKPYAVCNYIDKKKIYYTPNYQIQGNVNRSIDRIYHNLDGKVDFIENPDVLIGDSSAGTPFEFHFSDTYYKYMDEAIECVLNNKQELVIKLREKASEDTLHVIYDVFSQNIIEQLISHKCLQKKIVVIARRNWFEEFLLSNYGVHVWKTIYYDSESEAEEIAENLKAFDKFDSKDLCFVVPEIFRNVGKKCNIFQILYDAGYAYDVSWFSTTNALNNKKFCGEFEDIYSNHIHIDSPCALTMQGAGISMEIEHQSSVLNFLVMSQADITMRKSVRSVQGKICCYNGSRLNIEKGLSAGKELFISVPFLSQLFIGEDVMISFDVMIFSGDGHSIFQKVDGSYKLQSRCDTNKIVIGDHVWIGYGAKILKGTEIGDGSVVGAGAIVNKKFPNNVIITGIPARIIKTDIAWSRGVHIPELYYDELVYQQYANETQE